MAISGQSVHYLCDDRIYYYSYWCPFLNQVFQNSGHQCWQIGVHRIGPFLWVSQCISHWLKLRTHFCCMIKGSISQQMDVLLCGLNNTKPQWAIRKVSGAMDRARQKRCHRPTAEAVLFIWDSTRLWPSHFEFSFLKKLRQCCLKSCNLPKISQCFMTLKQFLVIFQIFVSLVQPRRAVSMPSTILL